MGRVINTQSTGKQRSQLRRTIAELLRRLSQKTEIDDDTKNMVAMIIYCLREIDEGIDASAAAWEKRDYWMKAEGFRSEWRWVGVACADMTHILKNDTWDELPQIMVKLIPRFADINIAKFTRDPDVWENAYNQFLDDFVN